MGHTREKQTAFNHGAEKCVHSELQMRNLQMPHALQASTLSLSLRAWNASIFIRRRRHSGKWQVELVEDLQVKAARLHCIRIRTCITTSCSCRLPTQMSTLCGDTTHSNRYRDVHCCTRFIVLRVPVCQNLERQTRCNYLKTFILCVQATLRISDKSNQRHYIVRTWLDFIRYVMCAYIGCKKK